MRFDRLTLAASAGAILVAVPAAATPAAAAPAVPRFDHVVVVMFENTDYSTVKGSSNAPYLNSLASQGALFTGSFALTHPSQPNYVGLFSGSTQGIDGDKCRSGDLTRGNLGQQLLDAGLSFKGYSENLPSAGSTTCSSGRYARKHAPWTNFPTVKGAAYNVPFTQFPSDFGKLPTIAFVTPNMCNDMHDCSLKTGDGWLKSNLDSYVQWAKTHNSLLIATFDEDDRSSSVNQIYTVFAGANVKAGYQSGTQINHYTVLRTLEDMYGLSPLGGAANKSAVTDVWARPGAAEDETPTTG
ncbi:alkaline phosphatase family protein [Sphaerisporangium fuscum]|uniref:alkaline phosphatase family protein n=1 Tax=Sphaerisporangium fuscum TaxID=2835868 RepID=UPI001BDC052B|nr:alkaline phosphatase family protein [Sphaerisporangium fuscum]